MDWKKKRTLMLIVSCAVTICSGSLYAWSVFATPLAARLTELTGNEVTSLAICFTMASLIAPVTMIFGGAFVDKFGPKWAMVVGSAAYGLSLILTGIATSVGMMICTYGILGGLGGGLVYGTMTSSMVKYFPDKGGLAGGLITGCYSGSSIFFPLVATAMLRTMTISKTMVILGSVLMGVMIIGSFVIGYCRDGIDFNELEKLGKPAGNGQQIVKKDYSYGEMLKTGDFYLMFIVLTCGSVTGMMAISQASPISQNILGIDTEKAAVIVSLLAACNTLGRLSCGAISDKLGAVNTLRITFIGATVASVMLMLSSETRAVLFYAGFILLGFCFGSIMGILPGFSANRFGRKNNSVNYGIMFVGYSVASLIGPLGMNFIFNNVHRYQPAFIITTVLAAVGVIIVCVIAGRFKKEGY